MTIDHLQLPAVDLARSVAFYRQVFGWTVDEGGGFEVAGMTGMTGQLTTALAPAGPAGPLLRIRAADLWPTLGRITEHGGTVHGRPRRDGDERWLVEVDDPAGNRIGLVVPVRPPQPQTLLTVRDVEASSRWYRRLLGLRGDHGGPHYERLLAGDRLVLQLHHVGVEHQHGRIADPGVPVGHGVLVWFGEVADFDEVVERAGELGAPIVRAPHRNPPDGQGNGPGHREVWIRDPDAYTVVLASPDGEAYEPA